MKNKVKLFAIIAATLVVMPLLTACTGLRSFDVVGTWSVTTFDEVLKTIPDRIAADDLNVGWSLTAPDNSVRFIWSKDYSMTPQRDLMLEIDVQPFLDAGLDPDNLPDSYVLYEGEKMDDISSKVLTVGAKLGNDNLTYSGSPTALAAFEQIVNKYRDSISYHMYHDHYSVNLGGGNMFEWAKDMKTNGNDNSKQDMDIMFVLNPEPFIAAGVDLEKIEGWAYSQVPAIEDGKMVQVWRFIKAFDLK